MTVFHGSFYKWHSFVLSYVGYHHNYSVIYYFFHPFIEADVKCVTYFPFKSEIVKSFINRVYNSSDCYCVLSIGNREKQSGRLFTQ